jgi:DNA-binding NarL/FixJ family response regulator
MSERKNPTNYTTVAERPLANRTEEATQFREQQGPGTRTIRLLLVDEHVLMREGLRKLLTSEEDLEVVGEAANGWDALKLIQEVHPDIVLLELELPSLDGLNLTRRINRQYPDCAILILAFRGEREQVVQALKSGARGYIRKRASIRDVLQAIRVVTEGGVYVEPEMTGMLVNELQRLSEALPSDLEENPISEKEAEIIRAVGRGLSNKEIARQLAYSEKTVKNYLSVIFQKLHLRDRTQVAIYALRNGLLSEDEIKQQDVK